MQDVSTISEGGMTRRGLTRAGFLGAAASAGAATAVASLGYPRSARADGSQPPLPPLTPGLQLPASGSTQQLLPGVVGYQVIDGYPSPKFGVGTASGPAGFLSYDIQRSAGSGSDTIAFQSVSGHAAQHVVEATATGSKVDGVVRVEGARGVFTGEVSFDVVPAEGAIQPAYRLHGGRCSVGDVSRRLKGSKDTFVLFPSTSKELNALSSVVSDFESAGAKVQADAVLADPTYRVLATLVTDPILVGYQTFSPSYPLISAGPWTAPSVLGCIDGKYVRPSAEGLLLWCMSCMTASVVGSLDQSGVTGFGASL
jgi:hypothetical protein